MRARYYSPDMRRFVNADIVAGQISNAVTLNRFAYANGNPVSFVDPFGLTSVAIFSGGETDLDPTDDYEFAGSGGDLRVMDLQVPYTDTPVPDGLDMIRVYHQVAHIITILSAMVPPIMMPHLADITIKELAHHLAI